MWNARASAASWGSALGPWVEQGQLTDGFSFGLTAHRPSVRGKLHLHTLSNNGTKCSGPKSATASHNDSITQIECVLKAAELKTAN